MVARSLSTLGRWRQDILATPELGRLQIMAAAESVGCQQIFARYHPDLLILTVCPQHPEVFCEVEQLIRAIRRTETDRHAGILVVADGADASLLGAKMLDAGADDFVPATYDSRELRARIKAALRLKSIHDELRTANHRLRVLSLTDELTGLGNMRSFNQGYGEFMRRCRAKTSGLGVMMLDLDHFKAVNDSTTHLVGSYVISEVGRALRASQIFTEGSSILARYGGDEFVAAVLISDLDALALLAERVRTMLAKTAFVKDGHTVRITCSIGVAWAPPGYQGAAESIIKAADQMLYRSKGLGRNRVSGEVLGLDDESQVKDNNNKRGNWTTSGVVHKKPVAG